MMAHKASCALPRCAAAGVAVRTGLPGPLTGALDVERAEIPQHVEQDETCVSTPVKEDQTKSADANRRPVGLWDGLFYLPEHIFGIYVYFLRGTDQIIPCISFFCIRRKHIYY